MREQPEHRTLVFLDEMGYYRWPTAASDWLALTPNGVAAKVERAGNNSQWRMVAALNALTRQVNYLDNSIVGRQQLVNVSSG